MAQAADVAKGGGAQTEQDVGLRRKLILRVAAGAVIIAALIGALAVYDALNRPAPAPQARAPGVAPPSAAPPEPVPEKPAAAAPPAAPAPAAEPAAPADAAAKAEPAAAPERTEAPVPVVGQRDTERGAVPSSPATAAGRGADRLKLTAPAAAPQREPAVAPSGYLVQVGVFSNAANAEELRARLTLNGIPSQVELRVQAGPFATRREAQDATNKLKALGITSTMLVPARR